jgi:hypothetical protein
LRLATPPSDWQPQDAAEDDGACSHKRRFYIYLDRGKMPDMPVANSAGAWPPTQDQTWLLQAAFWRGQSALEAWRTWNAHGPGLARTDRGSRRLLPHVYRNLRQQFPDVQLPPQLKEFYRRTWYRNQQLGEQAGAVLRDLHQHGLPTLVLKGLALTTQYYRDWGLRPMSDFDVLVPSPEARRALAILARLGWQPVSPSVEPEALLAVKQSLDFRSLAGIQFDLHWYALWDNCYPGADDVFWQAAVPLRIKGVATKTLCPPDQLLHVCVHGAGLSAVPSVRWAADAMQIISALDAQIDWDRLVMLAGDLSVSLPLSQSLRYLQEALNAPVPAVVLDRLAALPATWRERQLHRHKVNRRGLLGELPLLWHHHAYQSERIGRRPTLPGYLAYLRQLYGLRHIWQIPAFVLHKAIRRAKAVTAPDAARQP